MRFKNREEAAVQLANRLGAHRGRHPLVLAVPRGAVPMARIIADALDGDLDVVLVPTEEYLREEVRTQLEILRTRRDRYDRARAAVDAAGRIAIIVEDGVAGGSAMLSAR